MEISNITNSDRSEVLVQALPYIQKYQNKRAIIKIKYKRRATYLIKLLFFLRFI